ncbi:MAG: GAF domain-containing protein, partial [Anaerolineales bacterium]|nr:GAF domain-containing protein [Anaerolineales bacterium]
QPVLIQDLRDEPWVDIYYPLYADLEMRSELAVPLIGASGRLEGVVNLESQAVGGFDAQDRHLLQSLATQAVIAIQEVQLLDALQEVARLLLSLPCRQVLTRLVELACDLLNVDASAIWTLEGDQLGLQVSNAGYQRGEKLPLHQSLTGQAILNRCPVTSDDVGADPRFNRRDLARSQHWVQALIVPLLAGGDEEPIGAFSVYISGAEPDRFTRSGWDEKVLTCLAHYAALAVLNAARQDELLDIQEQHAVAETFAAVGDIATNVLHHLNNKVGAIPVRVQGIQYKCQSVLSEEEYLAANLVEIERSALEAMEAVRENLTLLHPVHLGPVNLSACVNSAIQAFCLPDGIRVQTRDLETLPPVVAGEQSLILVFSNLIENALNAMSENGHLLIQGSVRDKWVHVDVSDDGPGIDPELHDRIFELNFSLHPAAQSGKQSSHVQSKLGFGLWWVKTLMTRLGGSIVVESDGQRGTTFQLRLPRLEDKP